jgi:hypothetical protein
MRSTAVAAVRHRFSSADILMARLWPSRFKRSVVPDTLQITGWRIALAVAAMLAVAPASGIAQGGGYPAGGGGIGGGPGGGPGGGRGGGRGRNGPTIPVDPHLVAMAKTVAADPENPIPLILADRADLKLADSQTVALSQIQSKLALDNAPLHGVLDSLRPPGDSARRPDYAHLDSVGRDSLVKSRAAVAKTMGAIHDNDLRARQQAFGVLDAEQRSRVTDLEQRVTALLRQGLPTDTPGGERGGGRHGNGGSAGGGPSGGAG